MNTNEKNTPRPGIFVDLLGDPVIVYNDMSFEYWGDVSGDHTLLQRFFRSYDQYLLKMYFGFGLEFVSEL